MGSFQQGVARQPARAAIVSVLGIVVVVAVLVAGGFATYWWQGRFGDAAITGEVLDEFPVVPRGSLDPAQAAVVAVAEQQFVDPGPGTKYAEGVVEPWCADFVSWVMREAGLPLVNPNSGSWRIPGVYTLQEYYEAAGRFEPAGSGYYPRTGDVVLYSDASPFGQHTNIVLVADGDTVTTIGGNEHDAVRVHRFAPADVTGIVGFGRL